jgi:threonine dehydrogenase-like Zn-dependent dehydrogenase
MPDFCNRYKWVSVRAFKKMGDNVIFLNPIKDDIVKILKDKTDSFGADVVMELSGSVKATKIGFESLRKDGRLCLIGLHSRSFFRYSQ